MAQLLRSTRHLAGSFLPGASLAHFWVRGASPSRIEAAWHEWLASRELAGALSIGPAAPDGTRHLHAALSPFVPLEVAATLALGRAPRRDEQERLQVAAWSERADRDAFRLHHEEALSQGLPSMRAFFGSMPATLVGIGRHAKLFVMNTGPETSAIAALAGANKATGRALLSAHGLCVAPGALAWGWHAAVAEATRIGFPVVLKRPVSSNSDGVITGLRSAREVREAARFLGSESDPYVVEKQVPGREFRLHLSQGRVVAVLEGTSPIRVQGDGRSTLETLADGIRPGWLRTQLASPWTRRRLLLRLFGLRIRTAAQARAFVPDEGASVELSPRVGVGSMVPVADDTLHPDDRRAIERFLQAHGAPSGGMDVILAAPGQRIADGGAILELNVPSGFGYLPDPRAVARDDIEQLLARSPALRDQQGRVPVHVVEVSAGSPDHALASQLEKTLPASSGTLRVVDVTAQTKWFGVLNDPGAGAYLLKVTEEALLEAGFPQGIAPRWQSTLDGDSRRARFPMLAAYLAQAGCRDA